jgi:hypothetical protein
MPNSEQLSKPDRISQNRKLYIYTYVRPGKGTEFAMTHGFRRVN